MDQGEIVQQFCGMTGADTDFALSFLEANAWDLENAINLYLEGNFGAGGMSAPKAAGGAGGTKVVSPPPEPTIDAQGDGGHLDPRTLRDEEMARAMSDIPPEMYDNEGAMGGMYDDEGVRAPIMPKSEVLVEEPYLRPARMRPPRGEVNVFDMLRDYRHETLLARGGDDPSTKKIKTLADLFRPPLDLLEPGSFEHVKNVANQRRKWLLVNIQEVAEFDCQRMNRDTWADPAVKSIVRSHFVLWQVLKTSEEGSRYCRFYSVEIVPHIAIVDSRTGERLDVREGFIEPKELVVLLAQFLATNSLEDTRPTKPKAESPKRIGDLSEEAQLSAAIAASLGQDIPESPPQSTYTTSTYTSASTSTSTSTSTANTSTLSTPAEPATTTTTTTPPPQPKEEQKPAAPSTTIAEHASQTAECNCMILVRMPASEAIKGFFRPTDTLRTVHQYVNLHLEPNKEFVLLTSFPKKTYSGDLLETTLKQADLVPKAVLICEFV